MIRNDLRNVAIIAHVDHGKTTLVDGLLKQGGIYRDNQETVTCVMDSGALERERGITILAKNTAVHYKGVKINIVDTPGHADFGGEVERVLKMVNGVILLVDAAEGPMPQTRFVLSRALELGHRVIVVVNKIDRPDQRIHEVIDEVLELLLDLDATAEQLDSPMLFCSARNGTASYSPDTVGTDLKPLFDTILDYIPAPEADLDQPFQMLVSSIDYNEFVGRIAIGRIERGVLKQNQEIAVCNYHDPDAPAKKAKAVSMYEFAGLGKVPITEATAGNIIAMSGIGDITIGDTICVPTCVEPLPFVKISAPTVEMTFSVNDSPFAGREGKFVTSRQLRDRLFRETLKDVSLRVSEIEGAMDAFNVAGRGEMSLSILIETMRREGYEFQVSPPRVLYQTIDGKKCEPIERLVVDVPSESVGAVIEKLGSRKAELRVRFLSKLKQNVFDEFMQRLEDSGRIKRSGEFICEGGYEIPHDEVYKQFESALTAMLDKAGFEFIRLADIQLPGIQPAMAEDLLQLLAAEGKVVLLSDDLITLPKYTDMVAAKAREILAAEGKISIAMIRDMIGTSRKSAKPLLEYLDNIRVTRRNGTESERVAY